MILNFINNKSNFYTNRDPFYELFITFDDVNEKILNNNQHKNNIRHLYFGRNIIHNILYNYEQIISIEYDESKKSLDYLFYLDLLIDDNNSIINYTFSIDYIRILNNEKNNINGQYKLVIISKIIIDLINNFKGTDDYVEEKHEEELTKIENENKYIIKKNKGVFENTEINFEENNKIDKIYIEIIEGLIKNRKFDDYEYTLNIMNQLELEEIYPTETMIDGLSKILNSHEDYIMDYIIRNSQDIYNEKKINFNYLLLKYTLKSPIYIYQLPFLLFTKKTILEELKKNKINFLNINNNLNIKDKFYWILKFFTYS